MGTSWKKRFGEASAELERLKRIFFREPTLGPMEQDGEQGATFRVNHPLTSIIIEHLAEMLDAHGAVNYVSIGAWHPKAGRIECIVQRVGKLTPHTGRVLAEQHLKRAVALLAEHGIPWDGPTEFLPDQPVDALPSVHDTTPWLKIDFRQTPNLLRCERCGTTSELPTRAQPSVLTAATEAFRDAHKDCQEGDVLPAEVRHVP